MIMTELVVMMELVMVLTNAVPMGLWLVWWRAATLGIWKDIAGENQLDEIVVIMNVGQGAGDGGGSSDGENVGNLVGMFLMDMNLFE